MNSDRLQTRAELANAYQQQLQALGYEIRVAMQAIASNSLEKLEDSVATQQVLSTELAKLAKRLSEQLNSSEHALQAFPSGPVEEKVHSTGRAIHELNAQYSSLLKHSGRSIALLSSLCRSHAGQFPEARGARLKRQTWSCHM